MEIHKHIELVRSIKHCPVCGSKWESEEELYDIISGTLPLESKGDCIVKAVEYQVTPFMNTKIHLVPIFISQDKDFPDECFYQCPNCEEAWNLSTGRILTKQEMTYMHLFTKEATFDSLV